MPATTLPPQAAPPLAASEDVATVKACVTRLLATEARVPVATYRVQVHKDFSFADAQGILDYLHRLGISDLYSSPIFEARPGSTHGYDVVDHEKLNPELGGEDGFRRLSDALRQRGMGFLLDIVPNHMGVGNRSAWWRDVLENGQSSEYAEFFDIDWSPLKEDMRGKLLLPILGCQYGEELENGRITLALEDHQLAVRYYGHSFPVAPRSIPLLFPEDSLVHLPPALRQLLGGLAALPPHDTEDPAAQKRRRELLRELKPRMQALFSHPEIQPHLETAVARAAGKPGDSASFDLAHRIIEDQPYRLAFWRVSSEEINYRRFFDVNDLVGLRMENPRVFSATHARIRGLLAAGRLTGLRVDHCDGMFNPRQYLIRLQMLYIASQCCGAQARGELAPNGIETTVQSALRGFDWAASHGPLYTVVEKILEPREYLPSEWPVRGTSGYDFVYTSTQLFIQPRNEKHFDRIYRRYTGEQQTPDEIVYRSKLLVMQASLASEVFTLANLLSRLAAANRRARDFTDSILEAVIRETIACFPVYRTYIDDRGQYTDRDRTYIRYAIAKAKRLNAEIAESAFDFLRDTLLLNATPGTSEEASRQQLYFALKFQQLTGPVMAKGVEDTTFYRYNRFISANEVGGSVKIFGIAPDTFHDANLERLSQARDAMLATSTHDTKRSEDVRARLNVLSEMPIEWAAFLARVTRLNRRFKRTLDDGRVVPDANEEYLLYQTILGAWPWQPSRENFTARIQEYMTKALSEAKINLSWINPDPVYIAATHAFIADILDPKSRFVESVKKIVEPLALFGAINSLSQTLIKMTIPGVPDFYQGCELWEFSLVDPDNRRPVDYALRIRLLEELESRAAAGDLVALCRDLLASFEDGRSKLWLIHRVLQFRHQHHTLFRDGAYQEIDALGAKQDHVLAYERLLDGRSVIVIVPRFPATMLRHHLRFPIGSTWGDTQLALPAGAPGEYRNLLTNETVIATDRRIRLSQALAEFPVAILSSH